MNKFIFDNHFLSFVAIVLMVITAKHTIFDNAASSSENYQSSYNAVANKKNKSTAPESTKVSTDTSALSISEILKSEGHTNKQIVMLSRKYINTPYQKGGKNSRGFDCSGFVHFIYGKMGRKIPGNTDKLAKFGYEVPLKKAQKGDLIFFGHNNDEKPFHVGIVSNKPDVTLTFIHATTSKGVQEDTLLKKEYYTDKFLKVNRILD